jgi:hypothetical protein
MMQVRVICGAQSAYACIKTPTTSLDMMLSPGRSAPQSLRESAADYGQPSGGGSGKVLAAKPCST